MDRLDTTPLEMVLHDNRLSPDHLGGTILEILARLEDGDTLTAIVDGVITHELSSTADGNYVLRPIQRKYNRS